MPALLRAVDAHADGYVRFRALVLLTGFNDPRTLEAMRGALGSPNDRLRTVAYGFFEHNPDAAVLPDLLAAVDDAHVVRRRRAFVGARGATGLQVDDPVVQRASHARAVHDALRQRAAAMRALIAQRENFARARAEHGDRQAADAHAARAALGQVGHCAQVHPAHCTTSCRGSALSGANSSACTPPARSAHGSVCEYFCDSRKRA